MYSAILHASLLVKDLQIAINFYVDVLGLSIDESRPDLGYNGAWLNITDQQQIHLLALPNPDPVSGRPEHGGRDRHVAIGVVDFDALVDSLKKHNIAFTMSKSGRAALFCRDPDGNALEFIQVK
ncbi:MAG: VOC family protein [Gammaproteobacteria bacterium]|nr:VOC family protein [Gammaproteobacteria bacterium]